MNKNVIIGLAVVVVLAIAGYVVTHVTPAQQAAIDQRKACAKDSTKPECANPGGSGAGDAP